MADVERDLIAKALHTGAVDSLIAGGVDHTHFLDPECADAWKWIVDHTTKYKASPTLKAFNKAKPTVQVHVVAETLDYVRDQFFTEVKRRLAIQSLQSLADAASDPQAVAKIDELFLEEARRLSQLVPAPRAGRFSDMSQRIERWKVMKKTGGLPGIPFGVQTFDDLTLGVQPHELISIVGWQGTGKSTLLQHFFFNAYMAGYTPLIISLEMEHDAMMRKFDVMATHFQYHAVKKHDLSKQELLEWEKAAERASKAKNDIIVIDDIGKCTVDRVYAEVVKYKPDLVGIDYISLMEAPRSVSGSLWELVTHITKQLKQCARSLKIPHYAIAQTNIDSADTGARLENIAYSRSIGQDSDVVFGLHQDEEMRAMNRMEVRMLKNRDGMIKKTAMHWSPATMEFYEMTPDKMFQPQKEEAEA